MSDTESSSSSSSSRPLSLVIGNPAGDADSILSALCWAYVLATMTITTTSTLSIPILSISRHDLTTQRPETLLLLNWVGVAPDTLVDVTDVQREPHRFQHANVTLVDHNRLNHPALEESSLNWTVTGILDHHYDEGLYTDSAVTPLREIAFADNKATVASTTTLVAEQWLQYKQRQPSSSSSTQSSVFNLDSDVALLLLGTLLLDSVNMSPAAGKGTARDQAVIEALLTQTNWQDGKLVRTTTKDDKESNLLWDEGGCPRPTQLFERLQQAKFDVGFWQGLSVHDALRLDYKRFTPKNDGSETFGASTVLLDWDTFLAKETVSSSIETYMQQEDIHFLAIMCTFTTTESNALQRQLILCAATHRNEKSSSAVLDSMTDYLQQLDADSNLQLQERTQSAVDGPVLHLRVFDQGKAKASRKQVAPLLIRYFQTCEA